MSANYKRQHYVPQTYLQSWNDGTRKIYLYKKEDNKLYRHSTVDKVLYENDLYTKTIEDTVILTDKEKREIFEVLDGYKVHYKSEREEKDLTTFDEFATYYFDFENWTIVRNNDSIVSKKQIKDSIEKVRITILEEQWNCIENDWSNLRDNIEKFIEEKKSLSRAELEAIVEFLVAQKYRTPKALEQCKDLIGSVMVPIKNDMSDNMYEIERESLGTAYFKEQIAKFQNNDSGSNILKEIEILKQCHVAFIRPIGREFITSDNPVLILIDNSFFKGNYNGIYLPISPNLMVALYKGNNQKYTVGTLRNNIVRRFNRRMKDNSLKYYVTNYILQPIISE